MEKRENQQEKLLRAAYELVAENGVATLRTRDIAKRAGLSHGTLHYCFATKDELLKALYEFILAEFRRTTKHLEENDKNIRENLEGLARLRLHFLRSQDKIMKSHYAEQRMRFETILARGRADGSLPSNPPIPDSMTATMIVSLFEGLTVQWTIDQDCVDPDEYVQALRKLLGLSGGNV
jgi:AcrR family transcriptional regulator